MVSQALSINEIEAVGRVISIKQRNDGNYTLTLVTQSGKDAFLRFLCPDSVIPQIKERAHVRVHGYIKSYTYKDSESERFKTGQRFIATKIIEEPTLVESKFGIKGRFFPTPDCKVYLKGTVQAIRKDNEWYRIIIKVKDGDVTFSNIQINMKEIDRQPTIKENDVICCVCGVSSPKKELEGRTVYFENIQVSDIALA